MRFCQSIKTKTDFGDPPFIWKPTHTYTYIHMYRYIYIYTWLYMYTCIYVPEARVRVLAGYCAALSVVDLSVRDYHATPLGLVALLQMPGVARKAMKSQAKASACGAGIGLWWLKGDVFKPFIYIYIHIMYIYIYTHNIYIYVYT